MSHTLKELRSLHIEELVVLHDEAAEHTIVGTGYYLDELARRDQERANKILIRLTWALVALTVVLTMLTLLLAYDHFNSGFDAPIF